MSLEQITISVFDHLFAPSIADLYANNIESETLPKVPTGDHLKLYVLPLPTETLGHVSPGKESGLVQVSVFVKSGQGVTRANNLAEQVLDRFVKGLKLAGVQFDSFGSIAVPFFDNGWYITPVTIPYLNFIKQ